MHQLSSNSTLFWRIFLPFFTPVVLTLLAGAVIFNEEITVFGFGGAVKSAIFGGIWLFFMWFVFNTGWKMRRIEANLDTFTVTDFWKNARYTWESVERIESGKRLWVNVIDIWLHEPGVFGRRISFRPSRRNMKAFLAENPEARALFGKVPGLKN